MGGRVIPEASVSIPLRGRRAKAAGPGARRSFSDLSAKARGATAEGGFARDPEVAGLLRKAVEGLEGALAERRNISVKP